MTTGIGGFIVEPDDDDDDIGAGPPAPPVPPPTQAPPVPAPPAAPAAATEPPATPPAEPTPTELQEQVAKLSAAVTRNNGELQRRRQLGKWMQDHNITDLDAWLAGLGVDKQTGQLIDPDGQGIGNAQQQPPPVDEESIIRRVRTEFEKEAAQRQERADLLEKSLLDAAITSALKAARFTGTEEKALRLLDLERIVVGPDGKVTGVKEQIEELQAEIPEWFRVREPRRTPTDAGTRTPPPPRALRWDEQASNALVGRPPAAR